MASETVSAQNIQLHIDSFSNDFNNQKGRRCEWRQTLGDIQSDLLRKLKTNCQLSEDEFPEESYDEKLTHFDGVLVFSEKGIVSLNDNLSMMETAVNESYDEAVFTDSCERFGVGFLANKVIKFSPRPSYRLPSLSHRNHAITAHALATFLVAERGCRALVTVGGLRNRGFEYFYEKILPLMEFFAFAWAYHLMVGKCMMEFIIYDRVLCIGWMRVCSVDVNLFFQEWFFSLTLNDKLQKRACVWMKSVCGEGTRLNVTMRRVCRTCWGDKIAWTCRFLMKIILQDDAQQVYGKLKRKEIRKISKLEYKCLNCCRKMRATGGEITYYQNGPSTNMPIVPCNYGMGLLKKDDEWRLNDERLNVSMGGVIDVPRCRTMLQLCVRNISGSTSVIDVYSNETITAIKTKICCKVGVPADIQRLMFNGAQLNNDHTVFECGMQHGATVDLLLRIRGGSDQESTDENEVKQSWDEGRRKKPGWKRVLTRVRNQALEEFKAGPEARVSNLQYDKEFDTMMEKIEDLMTVGERLGFKAEVTKLQKEKEELEEKYDEFQKIREKHIKEELEIPVGRTRADADAGRSYPLRPLELPKFGGVQKEYESWSATIQVCVARSYMDEKEKLLYLRQSLTGEPRTIVEHFGFQDGAFEKALEWLEKKYGGDERNVPNVLREIEKLTMIQEDSIEDLESVIKILDHLIFLFKAKKEGELGKGAFYHMILKKFSRQLLRSWEREMDCAKTRSKETVVEIMVEWLKKEASYLKKTEEVLKEAKPEGKRKNTFYNEVERNNSGGPRTPNSGVKGATCHYCQGEHYVSQCKEFGNLEVSQRREIATRGGWCFNCLGPGHQVKACVKPKFCSGKDCFGKHHRLLHHEKRRPSEEVDTNRRLKDDERTHVTTSMKSEGIKRLQGERKYVTLRTLPIVVMANGRELEVNALLDDASSVSYVSQRVAQELRLGSNSRSITVNVIGGKAERLAVSESKLVLTSVNRRVRVEFQALTVKTISDGIHVCDWQKVCHKWKHLECIPFPPMSRRDGVDVLIGADYIRLHEAIREVRGSGNDPVARLTPLGWTCMGTIQERVSDISTCFNTFLSNDESNDEQLKRFWEIEELEFPKVDDSLRNPVVEEAVNNCEFINERYQVKLPFKNHCERIPGTRTMVERRGMLLSKRLWKDNKLKRNYEGIITDYLEKGYIRELSDEETKNVRWWLPHFPIVREDKETTKIRIVFDAAAKSLGKCLNDFIETGPKLQNDLLEVLLRFRKFSVALVSDVQEMYLQIAVSECDGWYLCFLHEFDGVMRYFRFLRLVFGLNASPFLAQLVSRMNADRFGEELPEAVDIIKRSTYMDDTMFSTTSVAEAKKRKDEIIRIWQAAGMKATKWMTNNEEILDSIPTDERSRLFELKDKEACHVKALGVTWDAVTDSLAIQVEILDQPNKTKRSFLRTLARIFDPMGLFSAYTIRGKIILQEIWMTGLGWDEVLPASLQEKIVRWNEEAQNLRGIRCERTIFAYEESERRIHIFSDASIDAYAAVGFAVERRGMDVRSNFVLAKTKVSPMKTVSVPRLELLGACLGVKLAQKISKAVDVELSNFIFWCDSEDVLFWITQHGKHYKTFVANRVGFIQQFTDVKQWRFVPTAQNPADVLSRGIKPEDYQRLNHWYKGPEFLKSDESLWPKWKRRVSREQAEKEQRSHTSFMVQIQCGESFWKVNCFVPETYSDWGRLVRTRARVMRFVRNVRNKKDDRVSGDLRPEELERAEIEIIRTDQRTQFKCELARIVKGEFVGEGSKIKGLNPFIDEVGLLRSRSRLEKIEWLSYGKRCPKILSGGSWITRLIAQQRHKELKHYGGESYLLAELNQEFWIVNGRRLVRKVKEKCYVCRRIQRKGSGQMMAPIPRFRFEEALCAFNRVGIDYAGPFMTKQGRRLVKEKRYMCLITCLQTRAVHLEMSWGLDTDSLVRALQRFVARRGMPSCIITDNGTNFVGATKEITNVQIDSFSLKKGLNADGITWIFNPPGTPHFGGIFEVMVREAKRALVRILSTAEVSDEELMSAFTEVERLLNGRPLVELYKDDEEGEVLTPNHFIKPGFRGVGSSEELKSNLSGIRRRWRLIQELTCQWWERWRREVIPSLRKRNKWMKEGPEIQVGEIVWQLEDGTDRGKWVLGRVTKLFPGLDGRTRVMLVKTGGKEVIRSVKRVCPLEVRGE